MALIGLVRVSTDKQKIQRRHDALGPICLKVFEEKISGKLATGDRPALPEALAYIRDGDMLCVQEVDRLGRNLLEGLIVLNDLFQRGIAVKVLEGIAAGEHTERSLILDLALALSEDRRRDIVRKTKDGLEAARKRGRVGGRRPVVDADKRAAILARRQRGESIRTIAAGVKVSIGVVHKTLADAEHERRWPKEIYGPYRTFHDLATARDWCAHCNVWIGTETATRAVHGADVRHAVAAAQVRDTCRSASRSSGGPVTVKGRPRAAR